MRGRTCIQYPVPTPATFEKATREALENPARNSEGKGRTRFWRSSRK